jgi:hypothetical protein
MELMRRPLNEKIPVYDPKVDHEHLCDRCGGKTPCFKSQKRCTFDATFTCQPCLVRESNDRRGTVTAA